MDVANMKEQTERPMYRVVGSRIVGVGLDDDVRTASSTSSC
jgi:hypothetical protein